MKNLKFISILVSIPVFLVGCNVATPMGTVYISYDPDATSENVVFTDEQGNKQNVDVNDLNGQIDSMLNDVDLPQGTSTDDLKNFVNGTTDALGVQDTIDNLQDTIESDMDATLTDEETTEGTDESNIDDATTTTEDVVGE